MKIKIFQFNLFGENTYIISDETTLEAAVIDPGMMGNAECEEFDRYISAESLTVKYLINTHIHVDHVAGDDYVEKHYGVGLSASAEDLFLADRIAEQIRMFGLRITLPSQISIEHPLYPGDKLALGDEILEIIAVPGHSPGSIAIYAPASKAVFVGDALFQGSIGRTDLPGGSYPTLIKSIRDNLFSLPDDTVVYSGHGPSTTIGREKVYNPFL